MLLCNALMAAEEITKPIGVNVTPIGTEGVLNTVSGLLLVLAVIFGAAWLYKRYAQLSMGGKGVVRVVGGASVGSRERVVVIEVDNTRLLLGVAPGQVRMLHQLSDGTASFKQRLDEQEAKSKQASETAP
jgi:flagellar protein FliO/FliZ